LYCIALHCILVLYVTQDDILLQSLEELKACGQLDNASFVLRRISNPGSFSTAFTIAPGTQNLMPPPNYMVNEAEVATYFEAPIFHSVENPEPANLYDVCHDVVSSFVSNRSIAL
jgi:hypothetical protein